MSIHYHGLSADRVADNRQRFGSNVISFPPQITLREKTSWVNHTWQIKLLVSVCMLLILMLPIVELLGIEKQYSLWTILLSFSCLLIFSYLFILLTSTWSSSRQCLHVSPLITAIILLFALSIIILYLLKIPLGGTTLQDFIWNGVGMIIVLIMCIIYYIVDHRNQLHFRNLMHQRDMQIIHVIRNGNILPVLRKDIVVHDLIVLEQGDEVPADAYLWDSCDLLVSELPFTGIAQCKKSTEHVDYDFDAAYPTNFLLAGSTILSGEAIAEVSAIGDCTIAAQLLFYK